MLNRVLRNLRLNPLGKGQKDNCGKESSFTFLNTASDQLFSIHHKFNHYIKPYYHKQVYSLSGFLHISSTLSFTELVSLPFIDEREAYLFYI